MKKFSILFVATSIILSGCSGNGSSITEPSPFTGDYTGTWDSAAIGSGTASVLIAPSGDLTGTSRTAGGTEGVLGGTIRTDGTVSGTVTFATGTSNTINGTWRLDERGHIVGVLTQTTEAANYELTFDMEPRLMRR